MSLTLEIALDRATHQKKRSKNLPNSFDPAPKLSFTIIELTVKMTINDSQSDHFEFGLIVGGSKIVFTQHFAYHYEHPSISQHEHNILKRTAGSKTPIELELCRSYQSTKCHVHTIQPEITLRTAVNQGLSTLRSSICHFFHLSDFARHFLEKV